MQGLAQRGQCTSHFRQGLWAPSLPPKGLCAPRREDLSSLSISTAGRGSAGEPHPTLQGHGGTGTQGPPHSSLLICPFHLIAVSLTRLLSS